MTLNTAGYTLGSNRALNHARILWNPITGTVTADGADGDLAANDLTAQRWKPGAGAQNWTLATAADALVDCVFIAAHNLAGKTVTIATSVDLVSGFTTRATVSPADNSTICALFNTGAGAAHTIRRVRVTVSDGTDITVGIIRAGVALQMEQPFYGGHGPLNWNRMTEAEPQMTEGGQWAGQIVRRIAQQAVYSWEHLTQAWYAANFEPFAKTLPSRPFGIVGNALRLAEADVGWCWTREDPRPQLMGVRDMVAVSIAVTGYAG